MIDFYAVVLVFKEVEFQTAPSEWYPPAKSDIRSSAIPEVNWIKKKPHPKKGLLVETARL